MGALMVTSLASRLRGRYLLAMGIPALAGVAPMLAASACARDAASPLVNAPLVESDAALVTADPIDAGRSTPKPMTSSAKTFHDPPEPTPPRWSHTVTNLCPDAVEAPDPAELPAPFAQCPKQANGGQFSAKATRAERTENPDACCYVHFHGMVVPGRPLRDGESGVPVVAGEELRSDWLTRIAPIDVSALASRDRVTIARGWRYDASLEHASVASFAAFALDLMALGAPADLVARAHAAALDEIRHASLCFAIAAAYDGDARGPGALPIPRRRGPPTFASLVRDTLVDGCFGETVAALDAYAACTRATEPTVRAALEEIARDEERHAELAFAALSWLLTEGGEAARASLEHALAAIEVGPSLHDAATAATRVLAAHGRSGRAAHHRSRVLALSSIVEPCVIARLATTAPHRSARPAQRAPSSAAIAARS